MKYRTMFASLVIVAVIAAIWLWFARAQKSALENTAGSVTSKSPGRVSSSAQTPQSSTAAASNGAPAAVPASKPPMGQVLSKAEQMKQVWAGENSKPQDFYGKVVDQYGQPVEGATAVGTLMWIQGMDVGEKKQKLTAKSDKNGEFEFTGIYAWRLGVVITKQGYEMGFGSGSYQAPVEEHMTSPSHRGLFKMWKLKGAEPMIFAQINERIPADGSTTKFDLLTGKVVSKDGDLVVKLTRNPVDFIPNEPHDWTVTFEVLGGGLVETSDPYLYEAPSEGYLPSLTINMPADMKEWASSVERSYYFKSRNGQVYGNMRLKISTGGGPRPLPSFLDGFIYANPAGSRNLEYDSGNRASAP